MHTPGPWSYDAEYGCVMAASGEINIAEIRERGGDPLIPVAEIGTDETAANAALIAAAPDLLAALKAIADGKGPARVIARDAITKAGVK